MKHKICSICKITIDVDKEYCEFKHYINRENIKSKAYYHVECFRNRLNNSYATNQVQLKAMDILNKIGARVS
jgi:hypothetical protein